jgi:hypothetical protein
MCTATVDNMIRKKVMEKHDTNCTPRTTIADLEIDENALLALPKEQLRMVIGGLRCTPCSSTVCCDTDYC